MTCLVIRYLDDLLCNLQSVFYYVRVFWGIFFCEAQDLNAWLHKNCQIKPKEPYESLDKHDPAGQMLVTGINK